MRDRLRGLHDDDRGTSLIELVVAMGLMLVFLSIFTTSIILVTRTATKVQAVSTTSLQNNYAFLRLDKQVRYADAISTPKYDSSAGMWHVEWASTSVSRTDTTVTTTQTCSQLRIDPSTHRLQQRTWQVDPSAASGYSQLSATWSVVASFITNGAAADTPFSLPALQGSASTGLQQLKIVLRSSSPTITSGDTTTNVTFTALNSTGAAASSLPVCQQVGVAA